FFFFFSSRRRHTRFSRDWSSDVCSSDLDGPLAAVTLLDELLAAEPEHADAHYLRGLACADCDDGEGMVEHFLLTLELDAEIADRSEERRVGKGWRSRGAPYE